MIWPGLGFLLESDIFYFAKSKFNCALMAILMVEMDSAPSKTSSAPKISEFDSCNLDF